MVALKSWARRALLAALAMSPTEGLAKVAAHFDADSGMVVVTGLGPVDISAALANPDSVRLRVANSQSDRGMLVMLRQNGDALILAPRFALKPGLGYELDVSDSTLLVALPAPEAPAPRLTGFAPSQSVIPANTLRLYLHFSVPMARGQLREAVSLVTAAGDLVERPFLALEGELWDPGQTRATLLLDPGRIKQGVGPNLDGGAPLEAGQSYRLTVAPSMQSAAGTPIGEQVSVTFRVGTAERRAIVPNAWEILAPVTGSRAPLSIAFDRIMDSGAALRLIELRRPDGDRVAGQITTDGGGWSLLPEQPWQAARYTLVVDPELEDVAGNTIGAPFDAGTGTIGIKSDPAILTINLAAE